MVVRHPVHQADQFDRLYATETTRVEALSTLQINSPNARFGHRYQPAPQWVIEMGVNCLAIDVRGYQFIDLGCGKGRALIVAHMMGFRNVIGVEFVEKFVEIAHRNVAALGIKNVSIFHSDAAHFRTPAADSVVFLYNPFGPEVMASVVTNLKAHRGRLFVVYYVPKCGGLLDLGGGLARLHSPLWNLGVWQKT